MLNPLPDALHFCSGNFVLDVTLLVLSVTFLLWCSLLVDRFTLTVCVYVRLMFGVFVILHLIF